jgi:hypothetical protein
MGIITGSDEEEGYVAKRNWGLKNVRKTYHGFSHLGMVHMNEDAGRSWDRERIRQGRREW